MRGMALEGTTERIVMLGISMKSFIGTPLCYSNFIDCSKRFGVLLGKINCICILYFLYRMKVSIIEE